MKRKSLPTGRDFLFVEGYGNENPGAFQSTRPLRGATAHPYIRGLIPAFQSTRPLRGATAHPYIRGLIPAFQSTRPLRGATIDPRRGLGLGVISIHAPIAGRDGAGDGEAAGGRNFNPRAPCGERPVSPLSSAIMLMHFNPRAPCGARLPLPDGPEVE